MLFQKTGSDVSHIAKREHTVATNVHCWDYWPLNSKKKFQCVQNLINLFLQFSISGSTRAR